MRRNCSGTRLPATLQVAKHRVVCESLEARLFLSVSNAIDEIDFGNAGSEAAHAFDTGVTTLPPSGTGAWSDLPRNRRTGFRDRRWIQQ